MSRQCQIYKGYYHHVQYKRCYKTNMGFSLLLVNMVQSENYKHKFKMTLVDSALSKEVHELHHTCLVSLSTGSPGNICQKSVSVFHHKQAIDSYYKHNDTLEVYANLSLFLYNSYKQTLDIMTSTLANLAGVMWDLNMANKATFNKLQEEKIYLNGLCNVEKTLKIEYWQKLGD
ncbi:hypothetical protein SERLADRAFT_405850 [Serpula lacrymans var. lacrymans S7.9]|uniref:Uncharacterized protein n=1 Tax=Serpula lacrymans var. lacrymans (strain S7.9) TaxID=578457 RepID=F8NLM8_SERL9|nr:uncharacterized protein SERLADRAFT_405850 [Serpula lacrymans var. lacrymans S7.9]EGO28209.1 hypothetical protein SERLADRAFT_405850 [Serpula lacrymans var. lacrymans S7.9]